MRDAGTRGWDALCLYVRYAGVSIRAQMQYRASFAMLAFAQLLVTATEIVGIWALFARFGSLKGWRLAEVALFYGIVNVAFSVAESVARVSAPIYVSWRRRSDP